MRCATKINIENIVSEKQNNWLLVQNVQISFQLTFTKSPNLTISEVFEEEIHLRLRQYPPRKKIYPLGQND